MSWLLPVGATAAAGTLTWFFCMRPMMRKDADGSRTGGGCHAPQPGATTSDTAEQIRQLRAELDELRAARKPEAGDVPGADPGTDSPDAVPADHAGVRTAE